MKKTQTLDYIDTEEENLTMLRNLDMKNHSIFNVGRPAFTNFGNK